MNQTRHYGVARFWFAAGAWALAALAQTPPKAACRADETLPNGSALCVELKIDHGRIALASAVFAPTSRFGADKMTGDALAKEAARALADLDSPCLLLMTPDERKRFRARQLNDAATLQVCEGSFESWPAYTQAFLGWAAQSGRESKAANILSEAGAFRPLVTLYLRTPLLWDDNRSPLDAEAGRIVFPVADRFDPSAVIIEITGAPDDAIRDRRLADLRRFLNPLRRTVFCHQRIRAQINRFYARNRVRTRFVRIDPNGPLIAIEEAAAASGSQP